MLEPTYAGIFFSALGERFGAQTLEDAQGRTLDARGMREMAESYQVRQQRFGSGNYAPYAVMGNGVAVVSVEGSLVQKTGNLDPDSGMQGYDGIRGKMEAALADPAVKGILLNVDSPGGEVSGAFDMADFIRSANAQKPVWSYAGDTMASAAYLLGSQAQKVYASQTASVGSIGVLVAHADHSKQLADEGVKITLIHSGKHKVDGSPYSALADDVKAQIQGEIDTLRDKFAGAAAAGRNKSKDQRLATEARVYPAAAAQQLGLVDGVMSFDEVIAAFSSTFARSGETKPRGVKMSEKLNPSPGLTDAEVEKMMSEARAEGVKAGAAAERVRVQAILGNATAEGRTATAQHLAFNTDMAADAALALLATTPQVAAPVAAAPAVVDPVRAAAAAGLIEGAGVRAEVSDDSTAKLSEEEKAAAATMAALSAMGLKMKA
jgi:signal peptide peptidase SppA